MFCKIYGDADSQVLVTMTTDVFNNPIISVTTEAPMSLNDDMGLVQVVAPCSDLANQRAEFERYDEATARAELAPWLARNAAELAAYKAGLQ